MLSQLQQRLVLICFPLPKVVFPSNATPHHYAFYIQCFGVPKSCCGTLSGFMHKVHISLQEFQAVAHMLHKMVFQLSSRMIGIHLDNNSAKAYLCNQGSTASLFLSRLGCHILNKANKHGITLIPAYILTHISMEADFFSWGLLVPEWHLLSCVVWAAFIFSVTQRWISWHPHVPINVSTFTSWKGHTSRGLGVEKFQPSVEISGELYVSSCFGSPGSIQVPGRTCYRAIHTSVSDCTLLDGSSLASHSSQHVG